MIGAGSTELLLCLAGAVGGGGSMVYAWPSFIMYRIATKFAGSEPIEVPLDADLRHDPGALAAAVRTDTKALFVCNPNNPTGTHLGGDVVRGLIDRVPDDVLVVIDEAYHEYVQSPDYESMMRVATERENVVVTRTFSKVYGLAGLRVGYAVGNPDLVSELRKLQAPFTVSDLAQVGGHRGPPPPGPGRGAGAAQHGRTEAIPGRVGGAGITIPGARQTSSSSAPVGTMACSTGSYWSEGSSSVR